MCEDQNPNTNDEKRSYLHELVMKNHTKSSEKDSGINEYVDQKEDEVIPPMIALYGSVDEIDFTLDTSYNDNNVKS